MNLADWNQAPGGLDGILRTLASHGDPDHDPVAAARIVDLAERTLAEVDGRSVSIRSRALIRCYLAAGLLGPINNGAPSPPDFLWDVERAIGQLHRAVGELSEDPDRQLIASIHLNLARAYPQNNGLGSLELSERLAIAHGCKAMELADREANLELWVRVRNVLATIYSAGFTGSRVDRIESAIELLEEAAAAFASQIGSELWCDLMHNLGGTYASRPLGDSEVNYAKAFECFEAVAAVEPEEASPGRWAQTQYSLGGLWLRRLDPDQALIHFERALKARERVPGALATVLLDSLYRAIASAYALKGDDARRVQFLRKAQALVDRGNGPMWARAQIQLASALKKTDPAEADRLLREALEVLAGYELAVRDRTYALYALAGVCLTRHFEGLPGALAEAIGHLETAKEVSWDDPRWAPDVCEALAETYVHAGRWPEAGAAYEAAVDRLDLQYRTLLLLRSRGQEMASTVRTRHRAAYALAKAGRELDAVLMLRSARARLLGEALDRDNADLERVASMSPELHAAFVEAAECARAVEILDRGSGQNEFILKKLANDARAAITALGCATDRIRELPGLSDFLGPTTVEDLAVGSGERLVFLVSTRWGSMVLQPSGGGSDGRQTATVTWVDGVTDEDVMSALGVDRKSPATGFGASRLLEAVDAIGTPFADALSRAVPDAAAITLVACGLLGVLPLHLASLVRAGSPRRLVDDYQVAYALSGSRLHNRVEDVPRRPIEPVVAVADPGTDLRYASGEVAAVNAAFPRWAPIYGPAATVAAVLAAFEGAGLLHLACHSRYDPSAPYSSGVHLADGSLTIGDLLADHPPRLRTVRLVVLSSCESAVVDPKAPDEVIGLPAAFIQAGAGAVIGSLWRVDDVGTAVLMSDLYRRLRRPDGMVAAGEPARALRASQLWMSNVTAGELLAGPPELPVELRAWLRLFDHTNRPFADPRHWGSFVVLGA